MHIASALPDTDSRGLGKDFEQLRGSETLLTRGSFSWWKQIGLFCAGLIIGFVGQVVSFKLALPSYFSSMWIPGGVLMGLLLLLPRRDWFAVTLGVTCGCIEPLMRYRVPLVYSLVLYVVACAAIPATAWALAAPRPSIFSSVSAFFRYLLLTVLVLSPFNGWFAAYIAYTVKMRPDIFHSWVTLAPGQAMGYLLLTPLIVAIARYRIPRDHRAWSLALEAGLLCLGLLILSMGLWAVSPPTPSVLLLLLLLASVPLLLLAALRFGMLGSSVSLLLIAVPAAWLGIYRTSAFGISGGQFNVHTMQLWLLALGLLVHSLAIQSQEQRSTQEQLLASYLRIRTLATSLLQGQEHERTKISRELHDGVNQQMALLAISMSSIKYDSPADVQKRLGELRSLVTVLTDDLRRISHNLRPGVLRHMGLVAALKALVNEISEHWDGRILFDCGYSGERPGYDQSLCLYRIAQEALSNAIKHSGAKEIRLHFTQEQGDYLLEIRDDGCGFDLAQVGGTGGLGLLSMEERANLVHGRMNIQSEVGKGTRLWIRIPSLP